ncbi:hypothetical protein BJ508DRAFT_329537 [Ascobolus immersus RN42]|uniref:CCHC-type domain-containing protein n=1 Tax=Ascobolus immersus RN42 TaxID=1160509 RepID=A0A3N4HY96_ASCIM|nr:hypothetical protein BJ508DRAFT_329537 [Ascobolus immersus RN42]
MSMRAYILQLEDLSDALGEGFEDDPKENASLSKLQERLMKSWLAGMSDERDAHTMKLSAKQEKADSPELLAKAARAMFLQDKERVWAPASSPLTPEIPVMAVYQQPAAQSAPPQGPQDLMEMMRQLSASVQSLQLAQLNSNARPTYMRPNHQRAQSEQVNYAPTGQYQGSSYLQPGSQQNASDGSNSMMCFNCRTDGHKAAMCPLYNPRRDGPQPKPNQQIPAHLVHLHQPQYSVQNSSYSSAGLSSQYPPLPPGIQYASQSRRDQSAPPTVRMPQPAHDVLMDPAQPRITPVNDDKFPPIHVERLSMIEGSKVFDSNVVDLVLGVNTLSSSSIAEALMADNKRARVEDEEEDARSPRLPSTKVQSQYPEITEDHYQNLMKDPAFRKLWLEEVTAKIREEALKDQAERLARKPRSKSIPRIKALGPLSEEETTRFNVLRLLHSISFAVAHPGMEEAIFSFADLLDVSPRLRQQFKDAMKSLNPKKRGRKAPAEQVHEDVDALVTFLGEMVEEASEFMAATEATQDSWMADEPSPSVTGLFYTYGMVMVSSEKRWVSLGAMLLDCGALLCLVPRKVVEACGALRDLLPVSNMGYRTAANTVHEIKYKWRTYIKIGRMQAKVTLFVTETDAPYGILLSRRFMQQGKIRADYEKDIYTMGDAQGRRAKVPRHDPTLSRPVSSGDIPTLVTIEQDDTSPAAIMGPPSLDPDVALLSKDQANVLLAAAARSLLVKSSRSASIFSEPRDHVEVNHVYPMTSGKAQFQV